MEKKKKDKVNLEKYRSLFFKTGILVALVVVYSLLNWNFALSDNNSVYSLSDLNVEVDYLPPVVESKPQLPKPKIEYFNPDLDENTDEEIDEFEPQDNGTDINEAIYSMQMNNNDQEVEDNVPFIFSEEQPRFPGGEKNLIHFIATHVKYPAVARENGIEGKVFVRFVIDEKGRVKAPEIIGSVDSLLDKEAIRVIKMLPRWRPGMNNGQPVKVRFTLPVTFRLQ